MSVAQVHRLFAQEAEVRLADVCRKHGVVLSLFVAWERHTPEPMLDMRYFRNPAFSTGSGGMILVFLGMYGVMFLITQYLQLVHGYSALGAAVRFLPMTPIMLIGTPNAAAGGALRRPPRRRRRHDTDRHRIRAVRQPHHDE